MRRLIVSTYHQAGFTAGYSHEVLRLWRDHLRGPGGFDGDIVLFTNVTDLDLEGVTITPFESDAAKPTDLYLARVLNYEAVPAHRYDSILQMDLDMLAVGNVGPLFATDHRLWVAPSNLTFGRQAWPVLSKFHRWWYRARQDEFGVSACLVSCTGDAWPRHMGRWARIITRDRDRGRTDAAHWGDQCYLNELRLRNLVPMHVYGRKEVQHREWTPCPEAVVFHFAGVEDRLGVMREYSVPGNPARPGEMGG